MHNQDHNSNLASNSSLSMRLLNPQTNFPNSSINYSLIGSYGHSNNLHAAFQGNSNYQPTPIWTLNDRPENNNTANFTNNNSNNIHNNTTTNINNNDNNFSINNQFQEMSQAISFPQPTPSTSNQQLQLSQTARQQNTPQQQQQQHQRLKVEDALNYLDQVKLQFGHQPQIYNDFLDIMKEFKSHSIDTTGVIMRVSRLFRGHSELIVGFNTFLPPGYNIEVHHNDTIQVFQPGHQVLNLKINNFDDDGNNISVGGGSGSGSGSGSGGGGVVNIEEGSGVNITISGLGGSGSGLGGSGLGGSGLGGSGLGSSGLGGSGLGGSGLGGSGLGGSGLGGSGLSGSGLGGSGGGVICSGGVNSNMLGGINTNAVLNNSTSHNNDMYNMQQHSNLPGHHPTPFLHRPNHQFSHNNQPPPPPPPPPSLPLHSTSFTLNSGSFPHQKVHEAPNNLTNHQPVEFNHAISYVNKIKNCYQDKPEIYKAFLDILHNYQKEQKFLKEAQHKNLNPASTTRRAQITESEVYSQVSELFQDQWELLREFRQFLPDATHPNNDSSNKLHRQSLMNLGASAKSSQQQQQLNNNNNQNSPRNNNNDCNSHPPTKNVKLDVVDKFQSLYNDPLLTQAVEKEMSTGKEAVLRELLRHLETFNNNNKPQHLTTLLEKLPELKPHLQSNFLKELRLPTSNNNITHPPSTTNDDLFTIKPTKDHLHKRTDKKHKGAGVGGVNKNQPIMKEKKRWYLDLSTCKRVGKSYRLMPTKYAHDVVSSRGELERQVLNDKHILYPHCNTDSEEEEEDDDDMAREGTLRRNIHEDHVFQCEDERYELDMVIDLNHSVLRELSRVSMRMHKMTSEELAKFQIEDLQSTLGVSTVHIQTVFKRLYGDKYTVVLEGLRKCPRTTIPITIRSLTSKDQEWNISKRLFERVWAEQMDKHYLRSLDHQGLRFKQTDAKAIRSKSLVKQVEILLPCVEDEDEEEADGDDATNDTRNGERGGDNRSGGSGKISCAGTDTKYGIKRGANKGGKASPMLSPQQLKLTYPSRNAYQDAVLLIWASLSKQSNPGSDDQDRLKYLLDHLFPSLFFNHNPPELHLRNHDDSEDEEEEKGGGNDVKMKVKEVKDEVKRVKKDRKCGNEEKGSVPPAYMTPETFICNENWYACVRLLLLLCERLADIKNIAEGMVIQEGGFKTLRSSLSQKALSARCQDHTDPSQNYPRFLMMVRNLMSGHYDSASFEDLLREVFGVNCYVAFTIDKLIHQAVRQLQHAICKEESCGVQDEYMTYLRTDADGRMMVEGRMYGRRKRDGREEEYQEKVEGLLNDKMIFKYSIDLATRSIAVELLLPIKHKRQVKEKDYANNNTTKNNNKVIAATPTIGQVKKEVSTQPPISLVRGNKYFRSRANQRLRNKQALVVWSGIPDFYRKFQRRQRLLPLDTQTSTQSCLMQALNTLALAHTESTHSRLSRGPDEDGLDAKHDARLLANNIDLTGKQDISNKLDRVGGNEVETQRTLHLKDGIEMSECKSNDSDFFVSLHRNHIKLVTDTAVLVCRPQSFMAARRHHKRKTLQQFGRFKIWLDDWLCRNTTETGVKSIVDWLQGTVNNDNDSINQSLKCADVNRGGDVNRGDRKLKRKYVVQKVLVNPDNDVTRASFLCHDTNVLPLSGECRNCENRNDVVNDVAFRLSNNVGNNVNDKSNDNNVTNDINVSKRIKLSNDINKSDDLNESLMKSLTYQHSGKGEINKKELINECINAFTKNNNNQYNNNSINKFIDPKSTNKDRNMFNKCNKIITTSAINNIYNNDISMPNNNISTPYNNNSVFNNNTCVPNNKTSTTFCHNTHENCISRPPYRFYHKYRLSHS